jgi:hypothetical protein
MIYSQYYFACEKERKQGEIFMNKKSLFTLAMAASVVTPTIVAPVSAATLQFSDVSTNSYAHDAIYDLVAKNVIKGFEDSTFRPSGTVTRGQFAAMLARALDLPKADSSFADLPKTKALYDEVSRAAAAGIILGNQGNVNSDAPVTRADIAVMLDRAINLKADITEKVSTDTFLGFKDAGSVPQYAQEAMKRMTYYKIYEGKSDKTIASFETADRASASVLVSRALDLIENPPTEDGGVVTNPENPSDGGTVTNPTTPTTPEIPSTGGGGVVTNPSETDYTKMTPAQLAETYGGLVVVERISPIIPTQQFRTVDYWQGYYDNAQKWGYQQTPEEYLEERKVGMINFFNSSYSNYYPKYEVISINGVAYKNSPYYSEKLTGRLPLVIPSQPSNSGQFLIDVHFDSPDFVTYTKESVKLTSLIDIPVAFNDDYIVNINEIFKNATGVNLTNSGLTLTYNGNVVVLTNGSDSIKVNGETKTLKKAVEVKNGSVYAPIRQLAEYLTLDVRYVQSTIREDRLEIANYPLEMLEGVWR